MVAVASEGERDDPGNSRMNHRLDDADSPKLFLTSFHGIPGNKVARKIVEASKPIAKI